MLAAGYFWPTARSGLDCSERPERRPVTIPALAIRTTVPTVALTFRPCPKPIARSDPETCVCPYGLRVVCVCVPPVCGPGPGLRPPVRGTAPRFPNRARASALASLEELRSLPASALSFLRRESGAARLLQSSARSVRVRQLKLLTMTHVVTPSDISDTALHQVMYAHVCTCMHMYAHVRDDLT